MKNKVTPAAAAIALLASLALPARAQLGPGWVEYSPVRKIHLVEKATNHDGKNYHKYGCYGTLKTGAVAVTWRRVRHYRDGRAPELLPGAGAKP